VVWNIFMVWRMRNHTRFKKKNERLKCSQWNSMVYRKKISNCYKKRTNNDVTNFGILIFKRGQEKILKFVKLIGWGQVQSGLKSTRMMLLEFVQDMQMVMAYFKIVMGEYIGVSLPILTIENVCILGFKRLWLEYDSMMVIHAFSNKLLVR